MGAYATVADFAVCRRLHRQYGTTYYFAAQRLPKHLRDRVHALYGFVRVADEWVDNPQSTRPSQELAAFRSDLLDGFAGKHPSHPVLRAFCDVALELDLPMGEPLNFLDAMELDLTKARYETYHELREYMRGSAASVGLMMCDFVDVERSAVIENGATALGEAMQLTNFLRDIREDLERGRIYLPQEDLDRFSVTEDMLKAQRVDERFRALMAFEIQRARALYSAADEAIPMLPSHVQGSVRLARQLYSRILDHIERRQFDVFSARVRTSRLEKLGVLTGILRTAD